MATKMNTNQKRAVASILDVNDPDYDDKRFALMMGDANLDDIFAGMVGTRPLTSAEKSALETKRHEVEMMSEKDKWEEA